MSDQTLIEPTEDKELNVAWCQFINEHGAHITSVTDRATGMKIYSNRYAVRGLSTLDLSNLVKQLRDWQAKAGNNK